tara:strand:- start:164 stop:559 length:396 start_codon:yes stop_codon:yes gene_type:complete
MTDDSIADFHIAGYRKEAGLLRKKVRELERQNEELHSTIHEMKVRIESRFISVMLDREIGLRREHLISLHNTLEYCRRFGHLTPHEDFKTLGFKDHRTLHRSCNRFVDEGFLVKIRGNPTSFALNPDIIGD